MLMAMLPLQAAGTKSNESKDKIYIDALSSKAGNSVIVPVMFSNENTFSAYQCDIVLPEGVTFALNEYDEFDISPEPSRMTSSHTLTTSVQEDGSMRVIVYSSKSKDIIGNEGALFYMKVLINEDLSGEKSIQLKKVMFSKANAELLKFEDVYGSLTVIPYFNEFFAKDTTVIDSYALQLPIELKNESEITSFEAKLHLPDGVTLTEGTSGILLDETRDSGSHSLTFTAQNDGVIDINCVSSSNAKFKGNDGTLFYLNLTLAFNNAGTKDIELKNISATKANGTKIAIKDVKCSATFQINSYKLIYNVNGIEYKSEPVVFGATLSPIAAPTKEGHTFGGWSEIPATMPAKDVIINGSFTVNNYAVTYFVDGEEYKTVEVAFGDTIVTIEAPTKEGHTFGGWSEAPLTMPAKDITINGSFTVNSYKLTYVVDGKDYQTMEVTYGDSIIAITEPTKEGHTFGGWSEIPATMPAKDVTINGNFTVNNYAVTYFVDGEEYKTVEVAFGDTIVTIEAPTKEGHTFGGWSEAPLTMPAKDVTINGSFTVNSYIISFIVDGNVVSTDTIEYSVTINAPNIAEREGYTFAWVDEIPAIMPAKDIVINGSFTINSYKLTYVVDGKDYQTMEVVYGDSIIAIATPSKEGYTFSGWIEIPATMPAEDVTVNGSFTVNFYTITYIVDGELYQTVEVAYGEEIIAIDSPVKEGYTFSGWSEIPTIMPAGDIVVTGSFQLTDITDITFDGTVDVYNLQGVIVKRNIHIADMEKELPKGIYIVNGKKIMIK